MHCERWIPVHCDATIEWERSWKVRNPGYLKVLLMRRGSGTFVARWCLTAQVFNAHMLRPPWMAQLRAARGWSFHSSGPCGKVGFFLLSHWNRVARWSVPMVTVDKLQFVGVHSRGCSDSVYHSQLWTLWIGVRESNVQKTV